MHVGPVIPVMDFYAKIKMSVLSKFMTVVKMLIVETLLVLTNATVKKDFSAMVSLVMMSTNVSKITIVTLKPNASIQLALTYANVA